MQEGLEEACGATLEEVPTSVVLVNVRTSSLVVV